MKKNNRSNRNVLATRGILLLATLVFLLFSLDVFSISCRLYFISDDVSIMEQYGKWTAADLEHYDELMAERVTIRDNSLTGFLLVQAGATVVGQIFRMIILMVLLCTFIFVVYLWGYIIKWDIIMGIRRIRKKIHAKRR